MKRMGGMVEMVEKLEGKLEKGKGLSAVGGWLRFSLTMGEAGRELRAKT